MRVLHAKVNLVDLHGTADLGFAVCFLILLMNLMSAVANYSNVFLPLPHYIPYVYTE